MNSQIIIETERLTKVYNKQIAVDQLSFKVMEGEVFGFLGPNGSGKTTLINTISGFYSPDRGRITFNGVVINGKRPCQIARLGIGRTFQFVRPFEDLSAIENVVIGVLYGTGEKSIMRAKQKALDILEFVGLFDKKYIAAKDLMMADRKRLEVGRALSINPKIVLLDEVFAGLNETEVKEGIRLVFRISQELGITILMIEHVLSAIMETCERILVLNYGRKIADGKVEEIVKNPLVIEAYLGTEYAKGK